jgi:pimeloyl-ACP methyl ester carboxylesterase
VVAFAPAGGWAREDPSFAEVLALQAQLHEQARATAPHAEAIVATAEGRRRATRLVVANYEHIPADLIAHQMLALANARGAPALIEHGLREGYDELDAQAIACPVRIVWGTGDRLLPWPSAAARLRREWLPHADWVELEGVGHSPQLDVPLEAAQLILGFTAD